MSHDSSEREKKENKSAMHVNTVKNEKMAQRCVGDAAAALPGRCMGWRARREWTPEEAARRDFELLRLLSSDRRVEATARRMGLFGAEALPSAAFRPAREGAVRASTGPAANDVGLSDRTCALRLSIRGHTCPVLTGEHSLSRCREVLGHFGRASGAHAMTRGMTLRWVTTSDVDTILDP